MGKKAVCVVLMMVSALGGAGAASLRNTDSQPYELVITEPGKPYGSPYRVIENAQVEICFMGCTMTLVSTGQTVAVGPQDTVVIDSGMMAVTGP
jgi:hypothetical protein